MRRSAVILCIMAQAGYFQKTMPRFATLKESSNAAFASNSFGSTVRPQN
jgi:hypothetical protein